MNTIRELLDGAKTIGLVDWRSEKLPRSLLSAGFRVISIDTRNHSACQLTIRATGAEVSAGDDSSGTFPPEVEQSCTMVSEPLPSIPDGIDLVCISRPAEEVPQIAREVMEHGVRAVWLDEGIRCEDARSILEAAGVNYVEDVSLADTVESLAIRK